MMADDTQTVERTAPVADAGDEQPQEGTPQSQADGGTEEGSEAEGRVRKANEEARKYRERARKAEAELEKQLKSAMSDDERRNTEFEQAKTRVTDLEGANRSLRVQLAALKVGVKPESLDDIPKLISLDGVDDPDDQKQVEKAVQQFLKTRPHYTNGASVDLDAGARGDTRPGNGKATLGGFIRREAGIPT